MFSMMVVCIKKMLYKYNASRVWVVKNTGIMHGRCGLSLIKPGCSYSPRFEGVVTFEARDSIRIVHTTLW